MSLQDFNDAKLHQISVFILKEDYLWNLYWPDAKINMRSENLIKMIAMRKSNLGLIWCIILFTGKYEAPGSWLNLITDVFVCFYCAFLFMLFSQGTDMLKSTDKICRQLIYHLTPHSKWFRKRMTRRKAQAWWEIHPCITAIKIL